MVELSKQDSFWVHLMLDPITYQEFIALMAEYAESFKEYYFLALDLRAIVARRMPPDRADSATIVTVRAKILKALDDRTRNMLRTVNIARTAPFYVNLTVPAPNKGLGFQANPTLLLERGCTPIYAELLMKKLYDPELVKYIMKRLDAEPHRGVGKIWKVMLSQKASGSWQVFLEEISPELFAEYLNIRRKTK